MNVFSTEVTTEWTHLYNEIYYLYLYYSYNISVCNTAS